MEPYWVGGVARSARFRPFTTIVADPAALSTYNVLDSPEAVLKMRIRELEKHERQLKQQVCGARL